MMGWLHGEGLMIQTVDNFGYIFNTYIHKNMYVYILKVNNNSLYIYTHINIERNI